MTVPRHVRGEVAREAGARADRLAEWEAKWSRPDFAPRWRISSIPDEIREAPETGWFLRGEAVLDIGCGEGEIAAWLAAQGYDVTGIDFAEAAIARARAAWPEGQGLRFERVDICECIPGEARYTAMLDRGCLHGVPPELRPDYVRNVAAAGQPGSRFLLLHRIDPNVAKERAVATLESLCGSSFDLERVSDTVLTDDSAPLARRHRGIALWMSRRS